MSKPSVNLTIHPTVLSLAERLIEARGYSSLSGLIEELIRDEYDRRALILKEDTQQPKLPKADSANYGRRKRKGGKGG